MRGVARESWPLMPFDPFVCDMLLNLKDPRMGCREVAWPDTKWCTVSEVMLYRNWSFPQPRFASIQAWHETCDADRRCDEVRPEGIVRAGLIGGSIKIALDACDWWSASNFPVGMEEPGGRT